MASTSVAECRNWQTNRTQNPAHFTVRVGSSPTSATTLFNRYSQSPLRTRGQYQAMVGRISGMPLNLYRRHRPECESHRAIDSRSGEFEERKKTWRKCSCSIFVSGTLRGTFKRKNTGTADWTEAKALAAQWEKTGRGGLAPVPSPAREANRRTNLDYGRHGSLPGNVPEPRHRHTDAQEIQTFIKQLLAYCDTRG